MRDMIFSPQRHNPQTLSLFVLLVCLTAIPSTAETVKDIRKKMGSRFEITAVHTDEAVARRAIEQAYDEIERIEEMISSWRPNSETSAVNRLAGSQPQPVSQELFNLVRRSLKLSQLTEGAFDITFAGVGKLWDFKSQTPVVPDAMTIKAALDHVGYGKIILDSERRSIYLTDPTARIGFGAIGKGYAANRAVWTLKDQGITSGVVNAGGDLVAFGQQEDGTAWDIGIAHPRQHDHIFARLPLTEQAVVTSGDYESFFLIDGKRYAHIIDPRTGYPVDHLESVTIVCPDAELADGLATAVAVMGPEVGLDLVNHLNGVEALLVDLEGRLHFSAGLKSLALLEGTQSLLEETQFDQTQPKIDSRKGSE